jgi:hypothetical protein
MLHPRHRVGRMIDTMRERLHLRIKRISRS